MALMPALRWTAGDF